MFFLTHIDVAQLLIAMAVFAALVASIIFGEIIYVAEASVAALVGATFFFLLTLWGQDVLAQLVLWVILAYIVLDVLFPILLAPFDLHWFESEEDRLVRISHENAAQYTADVIPFPKGGV